MERQQHGAGVAIAGAITMQPPLDDDELDQLELVALLTNHEALREGLGATVDLMLPGRPEGPSGWATCDDGCCLEVVSPHMKPESVGPWLSYLIERIEASSTRRGRRYEGSVVMWTSADRAFEALWVEGREVRSGRLQRPTGPRGHTPAPVVALQRRRA